MADHNRQPRVGVTLSVPMDEALQHLAQRSGLPLATQAQLLLRQALDRTIQSAPVQERIRERIKLEPVAVWRRRRVDDYQIERLYAESQEAQEAQV